MKFRKLVRGRDFDYPSILRQVAPCEGRRRTVEVPDDLGGDVYFEILRAIPTGVGLLTYQTIWNRDRLAEDGLRCSCVYDEPNGRGVTGFERGGGAETVVHPHVGSS